MKQRIFYTFEEFFEYFSQWAYQGLKYESLKTGAEWMAAHGVDYGYLYAWDIQNVSYYDKPLWTEEHIKELYDDFILIPKR